MCGIIGIVGKKNVASRLIEGLTRLEYRGYDSAGIAVLYNGVLKTSRAEGKIKSLKAKLDEQPIDGSVGIAHTRWATHGKPTLRNAHPHTVGRVSVVHNGIIENFAEIKSAIDPSYVFESETDTEVVAYLINDNLRRSCSPESAFLETLKALKGTFSLGVIFAGLDDNIFAARRGSPLAIGLGDGENYIGSDAFALASLTSEIIYLEEGDSAVITSKRVKIIDEAGRLVERNPTFTDAFAGVANKGNFDHFMLKEIYEQVQTTKQTISQYTENNCVKSFSDLNFSNFERLTIIGCGTAFYSSHVAKYWFEQISEMPCDIDIASEFRYRRPVVYSDGIAMVVSQSGETADTLAAMRYCQAKGLTTIALVNVMTSSMAREADISLPSFAGAEIGVASTKAFTSQLTALYFLAVLAAKQRGRIDEAEEMELIGKASTLSDLVRKCLLLEEKIISIAQELSNSKSVFFLGRGPYFPLALEGALKLKEVSYIHAEGFAAGEMKHGPIAMIEQGTPVVIIAPHNDLFEKTLSNMQEVLARGAKVILITDFEGEKLAGNLADSVIVLPSTSDEIGPIVFSIPIQLLAYHVAVALGRDVDQPRNLAKSVTVE